MLTYATADSLCPQRAVKYIFWDWDGTLCLQQYFWPQSRISDPEIVKLDTIWREPEVQQQWMLGQVHVAELRDKYDCLLPLDAIVQKLIDEWPDEATINKPLFSTVQALFPGVEHVITTDNMDIFSDYATQSTFVQKHIAAVFNSADYHAAKAGSPSLFEYAKRQLSLEDFKDVLLFDDSEEVCGRFIGLGGQAICVKRNEML